MGSEPLSKEWSEFGLVNTLKASHDLSSDEQSQNPEVETNIGLEATTESGECAIAVISSLSLSGCQLECGRRFVATILPNVLSPDAKLPGDLALTFPLTLPGNPKPVKISVKCKAVYVNCVTPKTYRVGCHFLEFLNDGLPNLQAYLSQMGSSDAGGRVTASKPICIGQVTKHTDPNFSEGMSDVYRALTIALSMKDLKVAESQLTEQRELDGKVLDLIRALIYAKEHFIKAQEGMAAQDDDSPLHVDSGQPMAPSIDSRQSSANLTDEELAFLLAK